MQVNTVEDAKAVNRYRMLGRYLPRRRDCSTVGGREARTVIDKRSLIFRFPLEQDHPIGTVVRPTADEEFLR